MLPNLNPGIYTKIMTFRIESEGAISMLLDNHMGSGQRLISTIYHRGSKYLPNKYQMKQIYIKSGCNFLKVIAKIFWPD